MVGVDGGCDGLGVGSPPPITILGTGGVEDFLLLMGRAIGIGPGDGPDAIAGVSDGVIGAFGTGGTGLGLGFADRVNELPEDFEGWENGLGAFGANTEALGFSEEFATVVDNGFEGNVNPLLCWFWTPVPILNGEGVGSGGSVGCNELVLGALTGGSVDGNLTPPEKGEGVEVGAIGCTTGVAF
jgi:hypothetical protein